MTWGGSFQAFQTLNGGQCPLIENTNFRAACNFPTQSYSFNMLDGTDSIACDPVQLEFLPDLAIAVFAANGIYCDHLAVNPHYNSTSPYSPPPVIPLTFTPTDDSSGQQQGSAYHATGAILNPGVGAPPPDASPPGSCTDATGNGAC